MTGLAKYDPDQPRDDAGKWTEAGGGVASAERNLSMLEGQARAHEEAGDTERADAARAAVRGAERRLAAARAAEGNAASPEASAPAPDAEAAPGARPLVPQTRAALRDAADSLHRPTREKIAASRGMTLADYDASAQRFIEQRVASADVAVRVHSESLGQILAEGRLKTQFESGTSGGFFDPAGRAVFESHYFGAAPEMPHSDRPVYGYLHDRQEDPDASGGLADYALEAYGEVALRLRPEVRERTTWNAGDSLSLNGMAQNPETVASPLSAPDRRSLNYATFHDPTQTRSWSDIGGGEYMEAQVWGGVRVQDIAEVVFYSREAYTKHSWAAGQAGLDIRLAAKVR